MTSRPFNVDAWRLFFLGVATGLFLAACLIGVTNWGTL